VGLKSVIQACSATLHTLVLEDCPQVGDASVIAAGECCRALQVLLLGGCRLLSDLAVDAYFRKHTNLRTLRVDNGIKSVFANCPSLECLDIRCCSLLTDRCFETLRLGANCLKELKISGCSGVTGAGIQKVAASCPHLSLLEAKYCDHISTVHVIGTPLPDGCKVILDSETLVF
jgi:F-box/leucine-rich repeat protein 2/20